jgi:hypothetical protein
MGLDQFAYATVGDERQDLAYWRKHNRLQGWMEDLWNDKGRPNSPQEKSPMGDFNCIPVQLTLSDIEQLEAHVVNKQLPETGGFFFGDDSFGWDDENGKPFEDGDYFHKSTDLKFIEDARKAISEGKDVYYDCWW